MEIDSKSAGWAANANLNKVQIKRVRYQIDLVCVETNSFIYKLLSEFLL